MGKVIVLSILAIIVGTIAVLAITTAVSWIWSLFNTDRQAIRDEKREARWAKEDLEDAVSRETRRKRK